MLAIDARRRAEEAKRGAGEILITGMDADGSVGGCDIPLTRISFRRALDRGGETLPEG